MQRTLALFALATLPSLALAGDWTGSGELGLAVSRGNSESENLNAKMALENVDGDWTHKFGLTALRSAATVEDDVDGDGIPERHDEVSANRYAVNASSAFRMNDRASWVGALRYENDDFASYAEQATFSLGFGYKLIEREATKLSVELGPGYRWAQLQDGGSETDLIFRSLVDYKQTLTETTTLGNTLLIEAGSDNRFAQDDFGVSVAINEHFALKAGLQWRYNSEIEPGTEHSDTLTTVNLVYTLK